MNNIEIAIVMTLALSPILAGVVITGYCCIMEIVR